MILGFITGILNKYIGAYFEDIDVSQLTGSIFGGGVTLADLNLRPGIFESLGIPFHVVAGKCGQLEVKYSLTRLYSEPVVVTLKDLHLLIVPSRCVEYDETAEKEALQHEKMRQLEIFESMRHHLVTMQQRRATRANKAGGVQHAIFYDVPDPIQQQQAPQEVTYFDMWVMQVARNVQVNIEGLHVRFEDDVTKPSEPFAVGIFLASLKVVTTDSDWKTQFVKDYVPETSYKLVQIGGLEVYWNPSPTPLHKGIQDKNVIFQRLAMTPQTHSKAYHRLFEPLSINLKVHITPFPDIIADPFSKPRVLIEASLDVFSLNGSDKQFKDIIPFMETLDMLTKSHKYRRFRVHLHNVPVEGNSKEWWKFAYNCILADIQRRRNNFRWSNIKAHRKKCKKYLKAYYMKKVENKSSAQLEQTISKLEEELDLFMLILLRELVNTVKLNREQHEHDAPVQAPEEESYVYWLASWLYSYWFPAAELPEEFSQTDVQQPPAQQQTDAQQPQNQSGPNFSTQQLSHKDKDMICLAIGFAKKADILSYPHDYIVLEVNILLNQLRARIFRIVNRHPETVLEGAMDKVSFAVRCRPVHEGLEVEIKMGRIEMYGGDFPKEGTTHDLNGAAPLITTANPTVTEYFIKFAYEKNPLDSEVDQKVSFEGLAIQFTYLSDSIDRIAECFNVPVVKQDVPKSGGRIPASKVLQKVMQFRNSPTTRLLRMMEEEGKVELNICLISPYLVIPQDSSIRGKANFIVVNLGEINVVGTLVGGTVCENGTCSHFL